MDGEREKFAREWIDKNGIIDPCEKDICLKAIRDTWQASLPSAQPSDVVCKECKNDEVQRHWHLASIMEIADCEMRETVEEIILTDFALNKHPEETARTIVNAIKKQAAIAAMPNKHEKALKVLREALDSAQQNAYMIVALGTADKPTIDWANAIRLKPLAALATVDEMMGE